MRDARDGRDPQSIFIEGRRLAAELLSGSLKIHECLVTSTAADRPEIRKLLDQLRARGAAPLVAPPAVMAFVSDLETPSGMVVRAERPLPAPLSPDKPSLNGPRALLVILDGLQSPANAGAVLRVAEAAGANAVIATPGTADLFSPKALRASAGSALRLPIAQSRSLKSLAPLFSTFTLVAADHNAHLAHEDFDWRRPVALILGAEGAGLSDLSAMKVERVRIPMEGKVESLNVAVAAGILLMEAARQRRKKGG